ncbi:GNAT family N-acetyltransferase [Aquibium oceanicum]|uniref:GNAT family N-acetyltransferase n=2 Tax=Aquibium oceanicum TaxID=1670800 RepID=A0A1L3SZA7_9HYPH|nr:GNAT family N-acetyltransferase [Aquibium oceanicum]
MLIRLLTGDDWETLKKMRIEAMEAAPGAFAEVPADWENMDERQVRARMSRIDFFVAFDDAGEAVGFMGLVRQPTSKMAHRATLIMVYLRESARGSGVSKALHEAVMKHARAIGVRQIELAVSVENPVAQEFYKRRGYAQIGMVPGGFLHEGREVDEILMAIRTQVEPSDTERQKS